MRNVFLPSYSIGEDVYSQVPKLALQYGKKVVFIGGKTALEKAAHKVKEELEKSEVEVLDTLWFGGEAAYENVENLKNNKNVQDADIIFAFGGGKALDTSKILTGKLNKTLFNFPTIAATCAAVTSVCAVYNLDGSFSGAYWRDKPAEHTFINTKIIAEAPEKYLWAGIGDTLAKAYEPEFSSRGQNLDYYTSLAMKMTSLCSEPLVEFGSKALRDCKTNEVSRSLEEVVLSVIINTGLVSNHVIMDYNSCVAHAVCYGFTTLERVERKHLHGELVSYGVLVQLMLDKKYKEIDKLLPFYQEINLPTSYTCFGVEFDELDGVVSKAISVNDVKVAAIEVTFDNLKQAIKDLEDYVNKKNC